MKFYIGEGDTQRGPFSTEELKELQQNGQIRPQTVLLDDEGEPVFASAILEFDLIQEPIVMPEAVQRQLDKSPTLDGKERHRIARMYAEQQIPSPWTGHDPLAERPREWMFWSPFDRAYSGNTRGPVKNFQYPIPSMIISIFGSLLFITVAPLLCPIIGLLLAYIALRQKQKGAGYAIAVALILLGICTGATIALHRSFINAPSYEQPARQSAPVSFVMAP